MATIDYFKKQAKLLLKDYNSFLLDDFEQSKNVYEYPQEHFDISNILSKVQKQKGNNITLMNAQHILAKISGFKNWNDLLHSSEAQQEIGALKLKCYKIGMKPDIIEAAQMFVGSELFVDFPNDDYTDEDELKMWKYVMKRLLF